MNELEFLKRIIDHRFQSPNQRKLSESKATGSFAINIPADDHVDYMVYRFDLEETADFLPFFNKKNAAGPDQAPRGLNEFCDYVILAVHRKLLNIILVELKSGGTKGATEQLDASEVFMQYIVQSAERICTRNNVDFQKNRIRWHKIILRNGPMRMTTNPRDSQPDWAAEYVTLHWKDLPLRQVCIK